MEKVHRAIAIRKPRWLILVLVTFAQVLLRGSAEWRSPYCYAWSSTTPTVTVFIRPSAE